MIDTRLYDAIQQKDINAIRALAEEFKMRISLMKDMDSKRTYKALIRSADRAIITIIRERN